MRSKAPGPITPEGKARSSRNAIRHGLTAETVIAGLEDVKDYEAFEAAVTADYDAETAVQRELVLRLASVLWRLRRANAVETGLFESVSGEPGKDLPSNSRLSLVGPTDAPDQNQLHLIAERKSETAAAATHRSLGGKQDIVESFLSLAALPTFPLDRLSRHEHTLWRQARQLVFTLKSLRPRKRQPSHSRFPFSFRRVYPNEFE